MARLSIILLFLGYFLINPGTVHSQEEEKSIFQHDRLHQILIRSNSLDHVWDSISREYVMVDIIIDDVKVDSIGIKLKGSTSTYSPQKPIEIDFNKFVRGQNFQGLKKLNLRNNFKDPFLQKERLAYEIYRRAGLPSSRASFAEVYVDDVFRGVYTITEMVDKTFLKHYFDNNDGSLYKGDFGLRGLSVELKEGSMSVFEQFKREVRPGNLGDFVDLDLYLKQLAVDIIIGDWDSYAYNRHNFFIYHDPDKNLFQFINWDHNYAFSAKEEDEDLYPLGTFPSLYSFIEAPQLKKEYEEKMCALLSYLLDPVFVEKEILHNYNLLRSNSFALFVEGPQQLIDYIDQRKTRLHDTLHTMGVSCAVISSPVDTGVLSIDKVTIEKGKRLATLELFNPSNSDITLDEQFYFSNDPAFPKKWKNEVELTLHSKQSNQIQLKQHLGFDWKVKRHGKILILAHEDGTIIAQTKIKIID